MESFKEFVPYFKIFSLNYLLFFRVQIDFLQKSITKREKLDEPDIENKVKRDNSHCQRAADVKITKELFKSTYSLEVCTDYAILNNE